MFWTRFDQYGCKPALVDDTRSLTYLELHERVVQFSQILGDEKSLLLLAADNSFEAIIALYGALYGGHSVMLCDGNDSKLVESLNTQFAPNWIYRKHDDWQLLAGDKTAHHLHPDLALLISTSGSTGSSKCVRIAYQSVQANSDAIAQYLAINANDRAALLLPIHYCYGLSVVNSHLASGASVVLTQLSVVDKTFLNFLSEQKISSFAGVPYTFEQLERIDFRAQNLPSLRYLTQAGGRLDAGVLAKYADWAEAGNKRFFVMYGQTEATARIAYLPPELLKAHPGAIGVAIPGGKLELKDEQGNVITRVGDVGELNYTGANVMMGYATEITDLARGYEVTELATGDLAKFDEQGLFTIVGRLKRFSKIFGKRCNLDDIEKLLATHQMAGHCVSDDKTLFLCSETAIAAEAKPLIEAQFGIPVGFISSVQLTQLPLLATGKIDYQNLLAIAQAESIPAQQSNLPLAEQIAALYASHFNFKHGDNPSFLDLGGDSLTYVAISVELEKLLGNLPPQWPELTITELVTQSAADKPRAKFARMEASVALRAYAIMAVVMNHSGLHFMAGGAAFMLLMSGVNYSRFQFFEQQRSSLFSIVPSLFKNILVPYWGVLIGFSLLRSEPVSWQDVTLLGANIPGASKTPFGVWYIQELMVSIALVSLPMLITPVRAWIKNHYRGYFLLILAVAVVLRIIDGYFHIGRELALKGEQISWVLWLFALGMMINSYANEPGKRWLPIFATLVLPLLFYWGDPSRAVTTTLGGLCLILFPVISLPRLLVPVISTLAGTSLFIYLLHTRAPIDTITADWPVDLLRIGLGLLLGIIAYHLYDFGLWLLKKLSGNFTKAVVSSTPE
ncbi:AMP-binding protein [Halioxenophilus sp. WMMB6]|uniref:AMP-binding protein n=1 Tax=Halioxenophilus sp. WMMB6 TaxID=3073815 RepID=UPI00295F37B5|nr:AMP-binding protein [Halioxenophilus sp. WMMB6]